MIFSKEISAAWDNPANILIIYKIDPSPLQILSQTMSDKIAKLLESNERILDPLVGVYGYKDDWNGKDMRNDGQQQRNKQRSVGWKGNPGQRPAPMSGRGGRGMGRGGRGGRGDRQGGGRGWADKGQGYNKYGDNKGYGGGGGGYGGGGGGSAYGGVGSYAQKRWGQ